MKMKSNKVKMIITDSEGIILDEFNTEDDSDLFWELWNGKTNYYLTHRVTDAIEVAIEEKMEDQEKVKKECV